MLARWRYGGNTLGHILGKQARPALLLVLPELSTVVGHFGIVDGLFTVRISHKAETATVCLVSPGHCFPAPGFCLFVWVCGVSRTLSPPAPVNFQDICPVMTLETFHTRERISPVGRFWFSKIVLCASADSHASNSRNLVGFKGINCELGHERKSKA